MHCVRADNFISSFVIAIELFWDEPIMELYKMYYNGYHPMPL